MIPGFGKQSITIGSGPHCEIHVGGPGVAAEHARVVHQGGGQLVFVDGGTGQTFANGQPIAPGSTQPFDFRTQFMVGQTPVPNAHPALALMLMQQGALPATPGQIVFGREPARAHVVIQHSSVSGQHATVSLSPLSITDHGSTSGTWIAGHRLAANQATALDQNALVAIGPVPLPVPLALQLAHALGGGAAAASPQAAAPAGGQGVARPKHKTVIGQVAIGGPGQPTFKSIGRTPDNDIVLPHPQVSSKHAFLHLSLIHI